MEGVPERAHSVKGAVRAQLLFHVCSPPQVPPAAAQDCAMLRPVGPHATVRCPATTPCRTTPRARARPLACVPAVAWPDAELARFCAAAAGFACKPLTASALPVGPQGRRWRRRWRRGAVPAIPSTWIVVTRSATPRMRAMRRITWRAQPLTRMHTRMRNTHMQTRIRTHMHARASTRARTHARASARARERCAGWILCARTRSGRA